MICSDLEGSVYNSSDKDVTSEDVEKDAIACSSPRPKGIKRKRKAKKVSSFSLFILLRFNLMPHATLHIQVRSPALAKASSALSQLLPTISKSSVAGQCLSLLDEQAKAALESKMEVALHKTMRAELKSTCLIEAHGTNATAALVEHFTSCQEDVSTMRHALLPKPNQVNTQPFSKHRFKRTNSTYSSCNTCCG
jgi:hypothetical protein